MRVDTFTTGPLATNAYLLTCSRTKRCAIIDPAPDSARGFINAIEKRQLVPEAILLTHSHWDHIADIAPLKERWAVPVFVHPADQPNLEQPGADELPIFMEIEGVEADQNLHEGDIIAIGELELVVIATPGHTPGGVCFFLPKEKVLFSGDTLFPGSMGKVSFPQSLPKSMGSSLEKLARLPQETVVYPGHGGQTTIGEEAWLQRVKHLYPELYPEK